MSIPIYVIIGIKVTADVAVINKVNTQYHKLQGAIKDIQDNAILVINLAGVMAKRVAVTILRPSLWYG